VLSALYVANVSRVVIHGERQPSGEYWHRLSEDEQVSYSYLSMPTMNVTQGGNVLDILALDILQRDGGIVLKSSIIFLRPIPERYYHLPFVVGVDHFRYSPYPDILSLGVVMAQPASEFGALWRRAFAEYRIGGGDIGGEQGAWYSGLMPYKLWERHPQLVLVSKRLQVICYRYECQPMWSGNGSSSSSRDWVKQTTLFWVTWPKAFASWNVTVYRMKSLFGKLVIS